MKILLVQISIDYMIGVGQAAFFVLSETNSNSKIVINLWMWYYVNGKSYPFAHQETLNERDRINMELSEIFGKYISSMDDELYPIFSIE